MPKAGTRKVTIGKESMFLPEEEARITELLRDGCLIQAQLDGYKSNMEEIKNELVEIAEKKRNGRATMHLTSKEGLSATITWSREIQVDQDKAEDLRENLGSNWSKVFQTKTSYTMSKSYKNFMNTPQGDLENLKKNIGASFSVMEKKPSVKLNDVGE